MTMVEKVARALFARKVEEFVCDGSWEENASLHDDFRADARAAIEAMREPTDAMVDAARAHHEGHPYLPYSLFNSMIDAALNEEVSG